MKQRSGNLKWLTLTAYLVCGALIVMFTTPLLGWRALNVLTPSMKPAISPGSLVLVHRVPSSSLKPGQVVTYSDPHHRGVTITHRVVRTASIGGTPAVITKGDANRVADQPVPAGRVVGRVAAVIPFAGRVLGWLQTPLALLVLVIVPGLLVIWAEARRLRRILAARPEGTRTVRRLDGVYYRASALGLAVVLVALATGSTLSQLLSTASLTGNVLVATSSTTPTPTTTPTPSPSPTASASPCPDVTIRNTGPGSTNIVHCTSTFSSSSSSSTNVSISNDVTQSATSGSVNIDHNSSSTTGTPGDINNNSSSSIDVNISQ